MWGNIPDLVEAKANLPIVAKQVSIVIRNLKTRYNLGPEKFILTGHSYGSHMAGFIGQQESVDIINGIEPAGGLFTEDMPLNERLDAGDANCVQVIHTNAGQCIPKYFGVNFTCGTIDFWVNGGLFQPACIRQTMISFIKQDFIYATFSLLPAASSHFQALQYYKASMNPTGCQFVGAQCSSAEAFESGQCRDCGKNGQNCAVMGAYACDCRNGATGNYYLNTGIKCPFCDNSGLQNADSLTCGTTPP